MSLQTNHYGLLSKQNTYWKGSKCDLHERLYWQWRGPSVCRSCEKQSFWKVVACISKLISHLHLVKREVYTHIRKHGKESVNGILNLSFPLVSRFSSFLYRFKCPPPPPKKKYLQESNIQTLNLDSIFFFFYRTTDLQSSSSLGDKDVKNSVWWKMNPLVEIVLWPVSSLDWFMQGFLWWVPALSSFLKWCHWQNADYHK